jgi:hypothetical protein
VSLREPGGGQVLRGCGTRLVAVGPGCRPENPPTFKFCSECGAPLASPGYRTGLDALNRTLPRIPDARVRDALLASEPVARLREDAGALGVSEGA